MPNWCENDLTITGKTTALEAFREQMKGKDRYGTDTWLNEDMLIPYPAKYRKLDQIAHQYEIDHPKDWNGRPKDGFNQGGYEWCVKNWGTKWGFGITEEPELETYKDEGTLTYHFNSAWNPPKPLVEKMGAMYPELIFDLRYFESGGGFNGILRIEHGDVVDDRSGEYFGDRGG